MWCMKEFNTTVDELVEKILKNKDYFSTSGGVTFSGGEPLLHADFIIEKGILTEYVGYGSTVEIPRGIKEIGDLAFDENCDITKVIIPDGVTAIGVGAFNSCTNLAEIVIPESVKVIHPHAFDYCPSLSSVKLPSNLKRICTGVFAYCEALSEITVPEGIEKIDDGAFEQCVLRQKRLMQPKESIGSK